MPEGENEVRERPEDFTRPYICIWSSSCLVGDRTDRLCILWTDLNSHRLDKALPFLQGILAQGVTLGTVAGH